MTDPDPLATCRERCRMLLEIAKEARRETDLWRRRCEALGASRSGADMGTLAESLQAELGRLSYSERVKGGL